MTDLELQFPHSSVGLLHFLGDVLIAALLTVQLALQLTNALFQLRDRLKNIILKEDQTDFKAKCLPKIAVRLNTFF